MEEISGSAQHYAWGSATAIPEIVGFAATGQPVAEYWFGAHESAPSMILGEPLDRLVSAGGAGVVGASSAESFGSRLPYLVKLLAVAKPLSLQAHPDRGDAERGFELENAAGVPREAPQRTYKDAWPKPEMAIAVTEFLALCGFRDPARTNHLLEQLGLSDVFGEPLPETLSTKSGLRDLFLDLLRRDADQLTIDRVVAAAEPDFEAGELADLAEAIRLIATAHPGDAGILTALLMNVVRLQPGEALFVEPGHLHAYLKGVAVEVMANSDNVLRGGLTQKHVDLDELARLVLFAPESPSPVGTEPAGERAIRFDTTAPEFSVWRVEPGDQGVAVPGTGGRIVLALDQPVRLDSGTTTLDLPSGGAAFLTPSDHATISGRGTSIVTGPGV